MLNPNFVKFIAWWYDNEYVLLWLCCRPHEARHDDAKIAA
jgi:hypothetical protein